MWRFIITLKLVDWRDERRPGRVVFAAVRCEKDNCHSTRFRMLIF